MNLKIVTPLITYFTILIGLPAFSQTTEKWTAFWNNESQLLGFKNLNGKVMIEPKFMGSTIARQFENIIAVMEEKDEQDEAYYLTKSGNKIGNDSLHISDNGVDCESEGFIRFKDKKTDKVGMFNKDGIIVIPAIYNELSRVHNGLIWALKGAEKEYWDKHEESGFNHYRWTGGQELLLTTENNTLIENFEYKGKLDFYSLNIQEQPSTALIEKSFKGVNGKFYIFTDIEKEFSHWLKTELIPNLKIKELTSLTMDSLTYRRKSNGWITESNKEFLNRNFELIKERLQTTQMAKSDYFISIRGLNSFIYVGDNYDQYFNTCGEAKQEKYPVMDLIINNTVDSNLIQDHFDFLKTDEGYRLISVTIRNGKIK